MYGFLYITENLINNKKYLGFCNYSKTNWKTYLGSGKVLKLAIRKYGKSNFKRTIIFEGRTKEELSKKEIEFIRLYECVQSPEWYNLSEGGYTTRGFFGKKHSQETKNKMKQNYKQPLTIDSRKRMSEAAKNRVKINPPNPPKKVIIDGVEYPSINQAVRETGIKFHIIRKMAINQ